MKSKLLFVGILVTSIILFTTFFVNLSFANRLVCYDPHTKKSIIVLTPSLCPSNNILVTITDADLASLKNQQSEPQQKSLQQEAVMALDCSPQKCRWMNSPMTAPGCQIKYCCCKNNLAKCEIVDDRGCSTPRFPSPGHGSVPK